MRFISFLSTCGLFIAGAVVMAQGPLAPVAQPTAEQRAQIATLARAWEKETREANAARDKYVIALLSTLAELGLKPSEIVVTWNSKGEPVFSRAEPSANPLPDKKPEVKP